MSLPRLHLVTDTRDGRDCLPIIDTAMSAGLRCVQVRDKDCNDRDLFELTRRVVALAEPYSATVIVDNRADIAVAAGADGVHVGTDDLPIAVVREIVGAQGIVGATARTPEAARAAAREGANYLGVGPAYATSTKSGLPEPRGPEGVGAIAAAVDIPVIAIGGITLFTVSELLAVGAYGVAIVTAISEAPDPRTATTELVKRVDGGR